MDVYILIKVGTIALILLPLLGVPSSWWYTILVIHNWTWCIVYQETSTMQQYVDG